MISDDRKCRSVVFLSALAVSLGCSAAYQFAPNDLAGEWIGVGTGDVVRSPGVVDRNGELQPFRTLVTLELVVQGNDVTGTATLTAERPANAPPGTERPPVVHHVTGRINGDQINLTLTPAGGLAPAQLTARVTSKGLEGAVTGRGFRVTRLILERSPRP